MNKIYYKATVAVTEPIHRDNPHFYSIKIREHFGNGIENCLEAIRF